MSFFCRQVCCCCYSDAKKQTNLEPLRAKTITLQPTTSVALELHKIDGEAYVHDSNENENLKVLGSPVLNPTDKLGAKKHGENNLASDLCDTDLNDGVPTDEDLKQTVPSQTSNAFVAIVTNMMLDEIHEENNEKDEIVEESLKIDNNAVVEATDDEIRNALTKKTVSKSEAIAQLISEEKNIALSENNESTIELPTKPPRHNQILEEMQKNESENNDYEDYNLISKEVKISEIEETPKLNSKFTNYTAFKAQEIPASDSDSIKSLENSRKMPLEDEFFDDDLPLPSFQQDSKPEQQLTHDTVEKCFVNDVDNKKTSISDLSSLKFSKLYQKPESKEQHQRLLSDAPPLPTSSPPRDIDPKNRPTLTMYGALDSEESDESESESISNPPRKPTRVSVKESNVVVIKVTAADGPSESGVDSKPEIQKKTATVFENDNDEKQI